MPWDDIPRCVERCLKALIDSLMEIRMSENKTVAVALVLIIGYAPSTPHLRRCTWRNYWSRSGVSWRLVSETKELLFDAGWSAAHLTLSIKRVIDHVTTIRNPPPRRPTVGNMARRASASAGEQNGTSMIWCRIAFPEAAIHNFRLAVHRQQKILGLASPLTVLIVD